MGDDRIYTFDDIDQTYRAVSAHRDTREHILRYSRNPEDIRDLALRGVDMSDVTRALDLGCAYGFFTEKLVSHVPRDADISGVDLVEAGNRDAFLAIVDRAGHRGRFIAGEAGDVLRTFDDNSFDLVVASYSLYFFPHTIGEIARILSPRGLFIAITHSEDSLREIIDLMSPPPARQNDGAEVSPEPAIRKLLQVFSVENGSEKLHNHFGTVEIIPYENKLVFPREKIDDCVDYLTKKKSLLFKDYIDADPRLVADAMEDLFERIRERSRRSEAFEITKNDGIFRCYNPIA